MISGDRNLKLLLFALQKNAETSNKSGSIESSGSSLADEPEPSEPGPVDTPMSSLALDTW